MSDNVINIEISKLYMKEIIKRIILESLITPPRWGGRHTQLKNIEKNIPSSVIETKEGIKELQKAVKELLNDGWILSKKSTGEIHISLNPRKKKEIMNYIMR